MPANRRTRSRDSRRRPARHLHAGRPRTTWGSRDPHGAHRLDSGRWRAVLRRRLHPHRRAAHLAGPTPRHVPRRRARSRCVPSRGRSALGLPGARRPARRDHLRSVAAATALRPRSWSTRPWRSSPTSRRRSTAFRCTTPGRTLLDLGAVRRPTVVEMGLDFALRTRAGHGARPPEAARRRRAPRPTPAPACSARILDERGDATADGEPAGDPPRQGLLRNTASPASSRSSRSARNGRFVARVDVAFPPVACRGRVRQLPGAHRSRGARARQRRDGTPSSPPAGP